MKIHADPGTEGYVKFAKSQLLRLGQLRKDIKLPVMNKYWQVDETTRIHITSSDYGDWIKIFGATPWEFYVTDFVSGGGALNVRLGTVGTAALTLLSLTDATSAAGFTVPIRTGNTRRAVFPSNITTAYKSISPTGTIGTYAHTAGYGALLLQGNKSNIYALMTDGAGAYEFTDGTTHSVATRSTDPSGDRASVHATKTEGYFVSLPFFVSDNFTVYKPTGLVADVTVPLTYFAIWDPVPNYDDVFFVGADHDGLNYYFDLYRSGVLEHTTAAIANSDADFEALVASHESVYAFLDRSGSLYTGTGLTGLTVDMTILKGTKVIDNPETGAYHYDYTESVANMATDYYDQPSGQGPQIEMGFSHDQGYLFFAHRISSGGAGRLKVMTGDGTVTAFAEAEVDQAISHLDTTVAFRDRSCLVGRRFDATPWLRKVYFAWSDGEFTEVDLPALSLDALVSFTAGSQTVVYVYVIDQVGLGLPGRIDYLVDSTGSMITLANPPAIPATDTDPERTTVSVQPMGFIERKVGCRLMFKANRSSGDPTYHHWDETGAIFDYTNPEFQYTDGRILTVPVQGSTSRMELIDIWG